MKIELSCDKILEFAWRYDNRDKPLYEKMEKAVRRKYMNKGDLLEIAKWKWKGGRVWQLCNGNPTSQIRRLSRASFNAKTERDRIEKLLELDGVSWPMASVILHFSFPKDYPILDVRTMNAVRETTNYSFQKWWNYVELCRETATKCGISIRELDKALWEYGEKL